jgi:hypothetical protein
MDNPSLARGRTDEDVSKSEMLEAEDVANAGF